MTLNLQLELKVQRNNKRVTFIDAAKGLEAVSGGVLSLDKLDPIVKRQMRVWLKAIAVQMRRRHSTRWPSGTGEKTLSKRTGKLVESIERSVSVKGQMSKGGEINGRIGSPLIYANVQENGATIRAKRAQFLTVPLPNALKSNGVMKFPKARDYPRTFIAKSRKGNLIIFQKRGGRRIVPLFVLKRQVYVPPRLNLGVAVHAGSLAFGDRVTEKVLRDFQAGKI